MVNLIEQRSGKHKRCDQKYVIVISHAKLQINVLMFVCGWKWQSGIKDGPLPSPTVLQMSLSVKKTLIEKLCFSFETQRFPVMDSTQTVKEKTTNVFCSSSEKIFAVVLENKCQFQTAFYCTYITKLLTEERQIFVKMLFIADLEVA